MKQSKVLHVQKVDGIGGSEKHLLDLLPGLKGVGFEPTMLVLAGDKSEPELFIGKMKTAGIDTHVIPLVSKSGSLTVDQTYSVYTKRKF